MEADEVEEILTASEKAIAAGNADLRAVRFWKAVAAAKGDPSIRSVYATRLAAVDRSAFEQWAMLRVTLALGTWLMVLGTAVALVVIALAYGASEPWNGVMLLAGTGALLVTTHGLAHLAVGRIAGIRFTHWFIASVTRPQPGVKIDYETYLATSARSRALMHAAGAVTGKSLPFLMLGAAYGMEAQVWVWIALIALGVGQIVTDVLWSVGSSDWKRYRREMRYAR